MADSPKKKSTTTTSSSTQAYLRRIVPAIVSPKFGLYDADRWRSIKSQNEIAMLAEQRLIHYVQVSEWSVTARQPSSKERHASDINYYTEVLNGYNNGLDFDTLIDLMGQDALTLQVGGNCEIVRYKPGQTPKGYKLDKHPMGHVHALEFMDGKYIHPTGNPKIPIRQSFMGSTINFSFPEVGRILYSPRPEMEYSGYGRPPIEKVLTAMMMMRWGDEYYARLLLDTPEAGILYIGNMDAESAEDWLDGFRTLFGGIDPMKIPVLYGVDVPPSYIPFNKPPTDLAYKENATDKARVVAAGYGLKLSDLGFDGQDTLAGKIRDDRAARSTGYGALMVKVENMINRMVLPPYLMFKFKSNDDEVLIQKQRARLMALQAAKVAMELKLATAEDMQQQQMQDGLWSIDFKKPPEDYSSGGDSGGSKAEPAIPNKAQAGVGKQIEQEMKKVPAEQGGEGDVKAEKSLYIPGQTDNTALVAKSSPVAGSGSDSVIAWYEENIPASRDELWVITQAADLLANESGLDMEDVVEYILSYLRGSHFDEYKRLASDMYGVSSMLLTDRKPSPITRRLFDANMRLTQSKLKDLGVSDVVLYRPVYGYDIEDGSTVRIQGDSIQAWLVKPVTNSDYISMSVPADRVYSTPFTGAGNMMYEVLIIGSDDDEATFLKVTR